MSLLTGVCKNHNSEVNCRKWLRLGAETCGYTKVYLMIAKIHTFFEKNFKYHFWKTVSINWLYSHNFVQNLILKCEIPNRLTWTSGIHENWRTVLSQPSRVV